MLKLFDGSAISISSISLGLIPVFRPAMADMPAANGSATSVSSPTITWTKQRLYLLSSGARCGRHEEMEATFSAALLQKLQKKCLPPLEAQALGEMLRASTVLSEEVELKLESAILDATKWEGSSRGESSLSGRSSSLSSSELGPGSATGTPHQENKFFENYLSKEEWDFLLTLTSAQLREKPTLFYGIIVKAMVRSGWAKVAETAWTRDIIAVFKVLDIGIDEQVVDHKAKLKRLHKAAAAAMLLQGSAALPENYPEDPMHLEEPWATSSRRDGDLVPYPFDAAELQINKVASPTRSTHWSLRSAQKPNGHNADAGTQLAIPKRGNCFQQAQPTFDFQGIPHTEIQRYIKEGIAQALAGAQPSPEELPGLRVLRENIRKTPSFDRQAAAQPAAQPATRPQAQPSGQTGSAALGARPLPGTTGLANLIGETKHLVANKRAKTAEANTAADQLAIEDGDKESEEEGEEEGEEEDPEVDEEEDEEEGKGTVRTKAKPKKMPKAMKAMKAMKVRKAQPKPKAAPTRPLRPSELVSPGTNPENFPHRAGCATVYLDPKMCIYRVKPGPGRKDLAHVPYSADQVAAWAKVVKEIKKANE